MAVHWKGFRAILPTVRGSPTRRLRHLAAIPHCGTRYAPGCSQIFLSLMRSVRARRNQQDDREKYSTKHAIGYGVSGANRVGSLWSQYDQVHYMRQQASFLVKKELLTSQRASRSRKE